MDRNKELKDWRTVQCWTMPVLRYEDGIPICCVLGEEYGYMCNNKAGKRCRYSNLGE